MAATVAMTTSTEQASSNISTEETFERVDYNKDLIEEHFPEAIQELKTAWNLPNHEFREKFRKLCNKYLGEYPPLMDLFSNQFDEGLEKEPFLKFRYTLHILTACFHCISIGDALNEIEKADFASLLLRSLERSVPVQSSLPATRIEYVRRLDEYVPYSTFEDCESIAVAYHNTITGSPGNRIACMVLRNGFDPVASCAQVYERDGGGADCFQTAGFWLRNFHPDDVYVKEESKFGYFFEWDVLKKYLEFSAESENYPQGETMNVSNLLGRVSKFDQPSQLNAPVVMTLDSEEFSNSGANIKQALASTLKLIAGRVRR